MPSGLSPQSTDIKSPYQGQCLGFHYEPPTVTKQSIFTLPSIFCQTLKIVVNHHIKFEKNILKMSSWLRGSWLTQCIEFTAPHCSNLQIKVHLISLCQEHFCSPSQVIIYEFDFLPCPIHLMMWGFSQC